MDLPKGLQNPSRSPSKSQDAAQDQPEGAQERPRGAQDMSKGCLRATKGGGRPRAPKTRQRDAQKVSRTFQNRAQRAPGRIFGTILVGSCVRKALGPIVCPFFSLCAMRVPVKDLEKPRKNYGFCTWKAFSHDVPARTKSLAKYVFGASKTFPRLSQNPRKSSPERPQARKKRPT